MHVHVQSTCTCTCIYMCMYIIIQVGDIYKLMYSGIFFLFRRFTCTLRKKKLTPKITSSVMCGQKYM